MKRQSSSNWQNWTAKQEIFFYFLWFIHIIISKRSIVQNDGKKNEEKLFSCLFPKKKIIWKYCIYLTYADFAYIFLYSNRRRWTERICIVTVAYIHNDTLPYTIYKRTHSAHVHNLNCKCRDKCYFSFSIMWMMSMECSEFISKNSTIIIGRKFSD